MAKRQSRNKNQSQIRILWMFLCLILFFIVLYWNSYYIAYTIDYLWNRNIYTFKEEGQHKDNHFVKENTLFREFLNNTRIQSLEKMPFVDSLPIPEIPLSNLNPETVKRISHNFSQPFVVRGLIKDFDCCKKWDLDYFAEHYADVVFPVFSESKRITYNSDMKIEMKRCEKGDMCSMKEVCLGIRKNEPLYVNNISTLFTESEQARNELDLEKMKEIANTRFLETGEHADFFSQLFLGGNNTGTSLHCSSNINFFFNVKGSKRWGFISPKYTSLIDCQTSPNGLFAVSSDDFFEPSSQNAFLKIPRWETILHEGDFLFNPMWYWHAVKNESEYTIAVANRYTNIRGTQMKTIGNNCFFTFLQMFSPSYYASIFLKDITSPDVSMQEYYSKIVDGEIINSITKKESI
jgi:hypothetical protein